MKIITFYVDGNKKDVDEFTLNLAQGLRQDPNELYIVSNVEISSSHITDVDVPNDPNNNYEIAILSPNIKERFAIWFDGTYTNLPII